MVTQETSLGATVRSHLRRILRPCLFMKIQMKHHASQAETINTSEPETSCDVGSLSGYLRVFIGRVLQVRNAGVPDHNAAIHPLMIHCEASKVFQSLFRCC